MAQVEKYGCEKQRKWNGERDDEGSANITEKEKQDDRYQDHSLAQIVQHRVQRVMKQIAAVEHGNDLHTLGQDVIVELVHLVVNPFERGAFFGPLAHQHAALDDVGLIDNDAVRTMIGSGHVPQPNSGAPLDDRDVLYANWSPIRSCQHGVLDILYTAVKSERADVQLLQAFFDEAATGVHVVDGQLVLSLADAQAVGDELIGVDAHLIFARGAAEVAHVHDVRNFPEFLVQSPVFDAPQIHQVICRIRAPDRVPINLAGGDPVRTDLRQHARRHIDLREPFEHFLAVPIVDGLVVEDQRNQGKAKNRLRPHRGEMRNPKHLNFYGNRDLLFHFFSRMPGPLADD